MTVKIKFNYGTSNLTGRYTLTGTFCSIYSQDKLKK